MISRLPFVAFLPIYLIYLTTASANTCRSGEPPRYLVEGGSVVYEAYGVRTRVVDADPTTFRMVPVPPHRLGPCEKATEEIYGEDDHRVFYEGKAIPGARVSTFEPLAEYEYGRDSASVFYRGTPLADADPDTFKVLKWTDEPTPTRPGALHLQRPSGEKFSIYAVDRHHVWEQGEQVHGLDAATFALLPMNYVKDKNGVYQNGRLVPGLDPKTFNGPQPP